jgi:hypothetical protein
MPSLNAATGGKEVLHALKPEDSEEGVELKDLTEEEIEKLKKTLKPGEGVIQRDDEGKVLRIIVGEQKTHDEILEEIAEKVEAKTDVVRGKRHIIHAVVISQPSKHMTFSSRRTSCKRTQGGETSNTVRRAVGC